VTTLQQYDGWIKQLAETLDALGDYGRNTTLIVTTDHGRGDGNNWSEHGSGWPESKDIWFYARNERTRHARRLAATPSREFTHLDIRPTVEALIGLSPQENSDGAPIPELTGIFPPSPETLGARFNTPAPTDKTARRVKPL
jgi:arylsulfatase A-like enzyme